MTKYSTSCKTGIRKQMDGRGAEVKITGLIQEKISAAHSL
jgi:hypothetical protein